MHFKNNCQKRGKKQTGKDEAFSKRGQLKMNSQMHTYFILNFIKV